jgi:hypothetical protein
VPLRACIRYGSQVRILHDQGKGHNQTRLVVATDRAMPGKTVFQMVFHNKNTTDIIILNQ